MLSAVPFIMVLGNSMLIPVLPDMQEALGISKFQAGLLITLFSIPAGLTIPWAGMLSDRLGRKVIMVPAVGVYGLGGLIAAAAATWMGDSSYWVMMAGRIIQGIGAGGTYQLAMALVGDIFKSRERSKALGLLESANGLGKVISPVAGAAVGLLAWFAPFWVYGLLAIPIAIGVWVFVREPDLDRDGQSLKEYFGGLGRVFKEKGISLGASFLAGTIVLFILFGVLSWYSDVLEDPYGIDGIGKGFVLAGPVLFMAVTSYVSGTVLQKQLNRLLKALVVTGLVLTGGGLFLASFANRPVPLFLWLSLIGIGNGLVLPALNTLITSAADSRARGAVTAVYGTVRFFGVALGPPTFGLIDRFGQRGFLIAMAVLSAIVSGVCVFFIDQKRLLPENLLKGKESAAADADGAERARGGGARPDGRPPSDEGGDRPGQRPAIAYRRRPDEPGT